MNQESRTIIAVQICYYQHPNRIQSVTKSITISIYKDVSSIIVISNQSSTRMAGLRLAVSCILASLCFSSLCAADDVKVFVKGVTSIAKTDDNFVCATLDWWPSEKCDYNQCPWGKAGLLNLVCLFFFFRSVNFFANEYSY